MLNTLWQLFISFTIIGFTSFGGLSMIPLVSSQMLSHGWMTQAEVADIVAIAEMTPGPVGLNCATFAGMRTAGVLGALVSCVGVMVPSITLAAVVAVFFKKFSENKRMGQIMVGIRPATLGMVAGVIVSMALTNYVDVSGSVSYWSIGISVVDVFLLLKLKWDVPIVILINAILGIVMFGAIGLV